MSTTSSFVLVPGAWHGAWCWARVLPLLRAAGHPAHAVTLTGVGDRAHLLSPSIALRTHVRDVLNVMACEELDQVVLVGHSYAGVVITAVADVVMQRSPRVLRHLVYLDAVTPRPGESWSSQHSADTVADRIAAAMKLDRSAIPPPDASVYGLEGADRDWVNRRQTPHPLSVYQERLAFDAERVARLPRTFIDCTSPAVATIAVMRKRVRSESGWRIAEMATGHDPMVSAPEQLARLLLECAST